MADWNDLFKQNEFALDRPHPIALDFVTQMPPRAHVLDLGCGAGRHLVPMLDAGFITEGVDISPNGLERASKRLASHPYTSLLTLQIASMNNLPYGDEVFDGVLSVNVINHGTLGLIRETFAEVFRVLKPGGMLRALMISDEDLRCGMGERIEERTFVPTEGIEEGVPHHYCNRDDLQALADALPWSGRRFTLLRRAYEGEKDPAFGGIPASWGHRPGEIVHWDITLVK